MRVKEIVVENVDIIDESRLPNVLNLVDAEKLLYDAGYRPVRCKGTHQSWVNPDISGEKQHFPLPRHHTLSRGVTQQLYKLLDMKKHT